MEDQPMVSYRAGPMNSLRIKLQNQVRLKELHEELVRLKEDFFDKLDGRREMNLQLRAWMDHVRELVFSIDDWVEMLKMGDREIQEEINKFKARIEQARELCTRYNLAMEALADPGVTDAASGKNTTCSQLLLEETNGLLALEDSKSYLEESLNNGDMMLKVVSIFGVEGSGKTSLAKDIYADLHGQFDCQAFISVGRRSSVRTTLLNILHQVNPGGIPRGGRTSQDLNKVITELWEYLGTKRYFILLDGLWSIRAWKVINCAFPDKNRGSRVLTTTCIMDVAKSCSMHPNDVIYEMKALSKDNSRILFLQTIQAEDGGADEIPEVSAELLKNCDGMPLAIIVAGGLLSGKTERLANAKIAESNLSSLEQYSTSEGMAKILEMSYADLSLPMKSCFLYLSAFPEDYTISKDRLIRLWVAQGFIPGENAELLCVTGEKYFNELIIRGLIQPVFSYDDDKPVGCTIHGMIHDFVRSLSSKQNFVTVGADLGSGIFPCSTHTVRRFSLDCCSNRDEADILASNTVHLLSVPSLTVFGDTAERAGRSALTPSWTSEGKPVLPVFKLIRVLDLEHADNLRSHHLKGIEGLVLLKYLGLRGTGIDKLPEEIGELDQLEMLDVRQTKLSTLPLSIAALKRLVRLLLDSFVKLPSNMSKMEGLEEVSVIGLDSTKSFVWAGELLSSWPRLRVLGVSLAALGPHNTNTLREVNNFLYMVLLSEVRFLYLYHLHGEFVKCLSVSHRNQFMKLELTLSGPISAAVVGKITSSVTHLHIEVARLSQRSVLVLGELPHLVLLKLVSSGKDLPSIFQKKSRRCVISGKRGTFPRLKVFWFTSEADSKGLQFGPGAMPQLQRLRLSFSAWDTMFRYGEFEFGIEHLTRLMRVHATIHCEDATVLVVEKAEAAIREQARKGKTSTDRPTMIEFSRELEHKMVRGEMTRIRLLKKMVGWI